MPPNNAALDWWESARFQVLYLACAEFRFDVESTLPPQAGNANRWAADLEYKQVEVYGKCKIIHSDTWM